MVRDTSTTEKEIRQVRFPGLVANANRLGVTRNHLYLVLTGARKSQQLLDRLAEMHGGQVPYTLGAKGNW